MFGMTVIILWLDTDYVALKTFLNVSKALFIFFVLQSEDDRTYFMRIVMRIKGENVGNSCMCK